VAVVIARARVRSLAWELARAVGMAKKKKKKKKKEKKGTKRRLVSLREVEGEGIG